jgi:hypothetical protein
LLSPEEDSALKFSLGMDPESGDLIPKKGRKDDLTEKEKAELKSVIKAIRGQYRKER